MDIGDVAPGALLRRAGALGSAKKRYAHTFFEGPLWPLLSGAVKRGADDAPDEADVEAQRRARLALHQSLPRPRAR